MGKKVVIVGAVAFGPKVACRLRRLDPDAEILMIDRDDYISYGGCGIPYYIGGDVSEIKELESTVFHVRRDPSFFETYKHLTVRTRCEATAIDRRAKTISVTDLNTGAKEEISYDTLVLGLGSTPFVPPIPGTDLPGVHVVANLHHAQAIKDMVQKGKVSSAVIVGGGAIGLEMAEALTDLWGIETTVVEMMDTILPQALGSDMAKVVQKEMADNDIRVLTGERVEAIVGDAKNGVSAVRTAGAGDIPCQLVIFGRGRTGQLRPGTRGRAGRGPPWRFTGGRTHAHLRPQHLCGRRLRGNKTSRVRRNHQPAPGLHGQPPGPGHRNQRGWRTRQISRRHRHVLPENVSRLGWPRPDLR